MTARPMRVLVACEFTGTVRDAFAALGHDAWSCDLLPDVNRSNRRGIEAGREARLSAPTEGGAT